MTPAERAVIDAARALEPEIECAFATTGYEPSAKAQALIAAVRALPRPLSEQLAELRPGDVVEDVDEDTCTVIGNHPASKMLFVEWVEPDGRRLAAARDYRDFTRIISNPEADRG